MQKLEEERGRPEQLGGGERRGQRLGHELTYGTGLPTHVVLSPPPATCVAQPLGTDLLLVLAPDAQQLALMLLLQTRRLHFELQLQPLLQLLQLSLLLPAQPPQLLLEAPLQLLLLLLQLLTLGRVEGWQRAQSSLAHGEGGAARAQPMQDRQG